MAARKHTREQTETLVRLSGVVGSSLDLDRALRAIGDVAVELLEVPGVFFWMSDGAQQRLDLRLVVPAALGTGYPMMTVPFGERVVGWVACERRVLHVPDVFADPRIVSRDWWKLHGFTSALAVPIIVDDGVVGVLFLVASAPFRPGSRALAEALAFYAAAALRNAAVFARSEARRQAAEALAEVGRLLSQTLDPETVGQRVAESVCRLLDARSAIIYRLAGDGSLVAETISSAAEFPWMLRVPSGDGIAGLALSERQAVATPDMLADPRLQYDEPQRETFQQATHRALLAVPLVAQGREFGVVAVGDHTGRRFSADDIRLTQAFADQAAIAMHNARLFADEQAARASAQAAADALRESEAVLQRAMEVGQIGSWSATFGSGARLEWSQEVCRIFGVDPWTVSESKEDFTLRVHPDDLPAVDAAREAAFASGEPMRIDHRIVRPDGAVRWVHERADVVRDAEGRTERLIGVVQDIRPRKRCRPRKSSSDNRRRWTRSAGSPAASRTTSTTCSASSPGAASCCSRGAISPTPSGATSI